MSRKGPFGLWMGMTLQDLAELGSVAREIAPAKNCVKSVPKPHSLFEEYILQVAPKAGLCWIKAISRTITCGAYGLDLMADFDSLEGKLAAIYGKHDRTDLLMEDSIWDEPRDWMQSLVDRERYLFTVWSLDHHSTLPESLISVALAANATDTDRGYLSVEYMFANSEAAEAEISKEEDDAL